MIEESKKAEMSDSMVTTISRLVQWRIRLRPSTHSLSSSMEYGYWSSDPFKFGYWRWLLAVERTYRTRAILSLRPLTSTKVEPPNARFVFRIWCPGQRSCVSPVQEWSFGNDDEEFLWDADQYLDFDSQLVVEVEFLDLIGSDGCSMWPGVMKSPSCKNSQRFFSRMLEEGIHADVTINTCTASMKAHKAVLASCSSVFEKMFLHDLKEKESSVIEIEDMSAETCSALLAYVYGNIKQEDFLEHRLSLLGAANKYDISDLKQCCVESLVQDINSGNVLDRLQAASFYQLDELKKECLIYLFDFGKIDDLRDEMNDFIRHADSELLFEIVREFLTFWTLV